MAWKDLLRTLSCRTTGSILIKNLIKILDLVNIYKVSFPKCHILL